jgi:hypothetical protein
MFDLMPDGTGEEGKEGLACPLPTGFLLGKLPSDMCVACGWMVSNIILRSLCNRGEGEGVYAEVEMVYG